MEKCKHEHIVKEVKTYYKKHADMMICGYDQYKEDNPRNIIHGVWQYRCLNCGEFLDPQRVRIV